MRKRARSGGLLVAALYAVGAARGASAQAGADATDRRAPGVEPAPSSEEAETEAAYLTLIRKGLEEYDRGNWSEAKSFFARAHEVRPSARTLRGLGLASYELRSYVEAIGYLRAALATRERPLTRAMADQVRELLVQAQSFVARYDLELSPEGATLKVDGLAPVTDADGVLLLDPGTHELVARADGHQPITRRVVARANTRSTLRLDLPSATAPEVAGPAPAPEDAGFFATRSGQQWIGLGVGAAGVVGLGVSAVFAVIASGKNADSEAHCEGNRCNAIGLADRTDARSAGTVSTIAFIAGSALLAGGAVLYLTGAPSHEASPGDVAFLGLVPHADDGGAGLALWGRFR